jgi:hypothetical protein
LEWRDKVHVFGRCQMILWDWVEVSLPPVHIN